MINLPWWGFVLILVGVLLVGAVVGFLLSRRWFKRYLEKNPPVNEKNDSRNDASDGKNSF